MADSDITIEILKGIRSELRDFRQETSDFRQETNQRFGGVEDRLGEVEGRLAGVEGRLGRRRQAWGVQHRLEVLDERLELTNERLDIGNQRLDVIESTLSDGRTAAALHGPSPSRDIGRGLEHRHPGQRARDPRRQARNAVTSSPRMPRPFAAPGTRTHFVGDRPARLQHVRLEWDLDLARKRLSGTATLTLIARRDRLTALTFDAVELDVEAVTVDGRAAGFDNDGEKLRVVLSRTAGRRRASWRSRSATRASRAAGSTSSGRTPTTPSARCNAGRRGRTTTRATTGRASITRSRNSRPR